MTLNEIYQYVFGSWGKIDLSHLHEEKQKAAKQNAKEKKIKDDFGVILTDSSLSMKFRLTLRQLKSHDLEDSLYGNHHDKLDEIKDNTPLPFPTDDEIKKEFNKLDAKYGYFKSDAKIVENFVALFKACKLIADFFEKNNSANNDVACLHAYKMLVLFGTKEKNPFFFTDSFINRYSSQLGKPIHDTLVHAIPKNNPPIHLAQWQKLIAKNGSQVISIFQKAPKIEIQNAKQAPTTLSAAREAAALTMFRRAKEFPELATLCMQYNMSEDAFDKCLTIKPKKSDRLPNVVIDGAQVNHPGYFLVKLPIDDPRAYILGHITHCCQSMGGDSAQCVIDGITRENNGFYVLLKEKKALKEEKTAMLPFINNKINYEHYEIIGQGYAWLTRANNMTFDSWENRRPDTDNAVIVPMLKAFAEKITENNDEKTCSGILRVTIGVGGKTPDQFLSKIDNPEVMREGLQYGDSRAQGLIFANQAIIDKYQQELVSEIKKIHGVDFTMGIFSAVQVQWIRELFIQSDNVKFYQENLKLDTYRQLLKSAIANFSLLQLCILLHRAKALDSSNIEYLCTMVGRHSFCNDLITILQIIQESVPGSIIECFRYLIDADNNKKLNKKSLVEGLQILQQANKAWIAHDILFLLIHDSYNAADFATKLANFHQLNPSLITDEAFKQFIVAQLTNKDYYGRAKVLDDAQDIAKILKDYPVLNTRENFKLLIDNRKQIKKIESGLRILVARCPRYLTDENFKNLVSATPEDVDKGFDELGRWVDMTFTSTPYQCTFFKLPLGSTCRCPVEDHGQGHEYKMQ